MSNVPPVSILGTQIYAKSLWILTCDKMIFDHVFDRVIFYKVIHFCRSDLMALSTMCHLTKWPSVFNRYYTILGTPIYAKSYASCLDALVSGQIHPEPGSPVQILLTGNVMKNCSVENIRSGKKSCPVGW